MNEKESPFIEEEWKPITDHSVPRIVPNMYLVSNMGRIYNIKRQRFQKPVPTNYNLSNPYYRVALSTLDGKHLYYLIHRIVMIEFCYIPNYQEMQVNHKYGGVNPFFKGKEINAVYNLEWVTASENIQHAFDTGLKSQYKGEDCSYATITNDQAKMIAKMITEQKYTQKEIAKIIGCSVSVVADIAKGSNWKYIYDKYNLEKYKKKINKLSDEDLHKLCKYFEENKNKYKIKADLYKAALKDLFDIEYTNSMSASMSRYYNHITRKDITDQYNF